MSFAVDDFGADPTGAADSTQAFTAALGAAIASGGASTVAIGTGTYRLSCTTPVGPGADANYCFAIDHAQDLTLCGNGADSTHLVIGDPTVGGWFVTNTKGVTIAGFSVDYAPVPFTQGTITAVDTATNELTLQIDPGYPDPSVGAFADPSFTQWATPFTAAGAIKPGVPDQLFTSGWSLVPGTTDQFVTAPIVRPANAASLVAAGDRLSVIARGSAAVLNFNAGTSDVAITGLTVFASPIQAIIGVGVEGTFALTDSAITILPDSGRLQSVDGGGVILVQPRAAVTIARDAFLGVIDDEVNIYALAIDVTTVMSPTSFVVSHRNQLALQTGDTLQFVQTTTGQILGTATATSVTCVPATCAKTNGVFSYAVTLDTPITGVQAESSAGGVPLGLNTFYNGTTVWDLSAAGQDAIVQGNQFGWTGENNIRSCNAGCQVTGNDFTVQKFSYILAADYTQQQGPVPSGVVFLGNTVRGGSGNSNQQPADHNGMTSYQLLIENFASQDPGNGHVLMQPSTFPGPTAITLAGNHFIDAPGESVWIAGARQITLTDNAIEAAATTARVDTGGAISVASGSGYVVDQLTVTDPRPQTTAAVVVQASTTHCAAGFTATEATLDGSNSVVDDRTSCP